jgi:hypothetical protein
MPDWRDAASTRLGRFPTNKVMLIRDEDGDLQVAAFLLDVEIDPFRINFELCGTFRIETEELSYLMFDQGLIERIGELLEDAKELWEELEPYLNEDGDFDPPDDLITAPIETPDYEPEP